MNPYKFILASLAMLTIAFTSCGFSSDSEEKLTCEFLHDSVQDTEAYKSVIASVDSLVYEEIVKEYAISAYLGHRRNVNELYDFIRSKYSLQELSGDLTISDTMSYEVISNKLYLGKLGYCHLIWCKRKRILKEKYNIDWKTPAEMNPDVIFD